MASEKSKAREPKAKKSAKHQKPTKKTPPPAAYKSQEFVHESDSDEEGKNAKGKKHESEEKSDSDEELSSAESTKATSKSNGNMPAHSGSSSESEDDSEDSDEASEDEDSEEATNPAPVATEPTKQPAKKSTEKVVLSNSPPPFKAPEGFNPATVDETSNAATMLRGSNLAGKQIWYFTAPASVPISSLKEISLSDATNGKSVLSYKENDYGFMESAEDKTYTKIMVPSSSHDGYKYASKSIDRVFQLHRIVRNPTTEDPFKATVPAKRPVRQQPRGMQMRFRPIGFGSGETGRIGSATPEPQAEMDEATPATFRKAPGASDSDSDEVMGDAPPVTKKSHTKSKSSKSEKEPSLKRKHREGREKKSRHSSSSKMSSSERKELKRLEKKQSASQLSTVDNPSA
ncbi:hypothetical protein LZ554_003794 [Drepanopeziza brunnea f. sp. 'monogermtubi']|nr:hypothetical protein LZ554_003794 [Drepanopeziza brunnea f. sp. 'monogermtubi']